MNPYLVQWRVSLFSQSFSDEGIEGSFVRGSIDLVFLSEQGTFCVFVGRVVVMV